jgi:hypothetical protein
MVTDYLPWWFHLHLQFGLGLSFRHQFRIPKYFVLAMHRQLHARHVYQQVSQHWIASWSVADGRSRG